MADLLLYEHWVVSRLEEMCDVRVAQAMHLELLRQAGRVADCGEGSIEVSDTRGAGAFGWPQ